MKGFAISSNPAVGATNITAVPRQTCADSNRFHTLTKYNSVLWLSLLKSETSENRNVADCEGLKKLRFQVLHY